MSAPNPLSERLGWLANWKPVHENQRASRIAKEAAAEIERLTATLTEAEAKIERQRGEIATLSRSAGLNALLDWKRRAEKAEAEAAALRALCKVDVGKFDTEAVGQVIVEATERATAARCASTGTWRPAIRLSHAVACRPARDMLADGISIQATGEATNTLVAGIIGSLLAHIDELEADLNVSIAVGKMAGGQLRDATAAIDAAVAEAVARCVMLCESLADAHDEGSETHAAALCCAESIRARATHAEGGT